MKGLTERQKEILDFIVQFIEKKRYSPSYREIGAHFGMASTGSVYKHIQTLKRKGAVLHGSTSRTLALAEQKAFTQESIELSLIGNISKPIQLYARPESVIVPRTGVPHPEKTYAFRVAGNFFHEELIAEGDLLLVEVRTEVQAGETILAMVDGEGPFIKKYFRVDNAIQLTSANSQRDPLFVAEEALSVHGVVVGLIRSLVL
jgi:repressor LexA